ncbi:unnamed protein product [Lymnaea stagnalis]|uniref:Carbohydrate sulfotransferase n=1 Tax=Lymnaea stagnalis TaxID=6523 RepID=A0AAV2I3U6_LYMST
MAMEDSNGTLNSRKAHGISSKQRKSAIHLNEDVERTSVDVLESMMTRQRRIQETCEQGIGNIQQPFEDHILVSRMSHFFYCPVEKTASTFWRRFLYQLEFTKPMKSPFDVSVKQAYDGMTKQVKLFEKGQKLKNMLRLSTKILFVRDPYSRIFSAYVDKLLAPNPVFWTTWGVPAVTRYRPGAALTPTCGADARFFEFVSLIVDQEWGLEPHVMPIYKLCAPCWANYTVVGKMETFMRDTGHVLEYLGLNVSQLGFEKMDEDVINDAVEDSVNDAMSEEWLNKTLKCIGKLGVARRIWRKLQLRGFISWRLNFNLKPDYVAAMQGKDFIEILKQTLRASTDKRELRFQKRYALLEAFSGLKQSQLESIAMIFKPDFMMFGYDPQMMARDLKDFAQTGAFDWDKSWDLSEVIPIF